MEQNRYYSSKVNIATIVACCFIILLTACTSKTAKALEKVELGQKYLTELNYTEAIASFTEAIKLDPENIPAYMGRAEAYFAMNQYDESIADYSVVIEKSNNQPYTQANAYMGQGSVFEKQNMLNQALLAYESANDLLTWVPGNSEKTITYEEYVTQKVSLLQRHKYLCTLLELYENAIADCDALEALGENMAAERIQLQELQTPVATSSPVSYTTTEIEKYDAESEAQINITTTYQEGENYIHVFAERIDRTSNGIQIVEMTSTGTYTYQLSQPIISVQRENTGLEGSVIFYVPAGTNVTMNYKFSQPGWETESNEFQWILTETLKADEELTSYWYTGEDKIVTGKNVVIMPGVLYQLCWENAEDSYSVEGGIVFCAAE